MTDEQSTHDRLVNWARWSRSGLHRLGTCYSAEGRYRPEVLRGDAEAERRTPLDPIDQRDALAVMRALSPAKGFPVRWYLALSARYIWRLDGFEFVGYMRRHKVPVGRSQSEHEMLIADAMRAAKARLIRQKVAPPIDLG